MSVPNGMLIPLELEPPNTEEEFEDFCIAIANEIRHGRGFTAFWGRRSGKRRTIDRVNHLLGVQP